MTVGIDRAAELVEGAEGATATSSPPTSTLWPNGSMSRFVPLRETRKRPELIPFPLNGRKRPSDQRFQEWGGEDSNLRPADYESAALTN
jgi:hypothetical protein